MRNDTHQYVAFDTMFTLLFKNVIQRMFDVLISESVSAEPLF